MSTRFQNGNTGFRLYPLIPQRPNPYTVRAYPRQRRIATLETTTSSGKGNPAIAWMSPSVHFFFCVTGQTGAHFFYAPIPCKCLTHVCAYRMAIAPGSPPPPLYSPRPTRLLAVEQVVAAIFDDITQPMRRASDQRPRQVFAALSNTRFDRHRLDISHRHPDTNHVAPAHQATPRA